MLTIDDGQSTMDMTIAADFKGPVDDK